MAYTPTDICNRALDACGVDVSIGDIEEGTRPADACLRAYMECLTALLRTANWDFARKTADLVLIADATGQTAGVGTVVPIPWVYEYAYPVDCMKARFVPQNGPLQGSVPLMAGLTQIAGQRLRPAPFVVATDYNYPPDLGANYWEVQGNSPAGRTVILTNVAGAQCVYTSLQIYPSVWDSLFTSAMVAYLASEVALPLAKDKRMGLQMRNQNIAICKAKVMEARLADGNEGATSVNREASWIAARNGGLPLGMDAGNPWGADAPIAFSDGSSY